MPVSRVLGICEDLSVLVHDVPLRSLWLRRVHSIPQGAVVRVLSGSSTIWEDGPRWLPRCPKQAGCRPTWLQVVLYLVVEWWLGVLATSCHLPLAQLYIFHRRWGLLAGIFVPVSSSTNFP